MNIGVGVRIGIGIERKRMSLGHRTKSIPIPIPTPTPKKIEGLLVRLPKWQKDLKACWEKLEKGDYDWAHLAHSIWPNRVEDVCKHDRSIAIAHNLEHLCNIEPPKPKARRGKKQLK